MTRIQKLSNLIYLTHRIITSNIKTSTNANDIII
jgi:hypothetical protein